MRTDKWQETIIDAGIEAAENPQRTIRAEFSQAAIEPETGIASDRRAATTPEAEFIDRDAHEVEWQEQIVDAGIKAAEHRRLEFIKEQQQARHALKREGKAMGERHADAWSELMQRQHERGASFAAELAASFDTAPAAEAIESTVSGLSAIFSFFTSIADRVVSSVTGSTRKQKVSPDACKREREERERRQREQQQANQREVETLQEEQARERARYERRMVALKTEQAQALLYFEHSQETSTFRQAFETRTAFNQPPPADPAKQPDNPYRQTLADVAAQKEARQERHRDQGGLDLDR